MCEHFESTAIYLLMHTIIISEMIRKTITTNIPSADVVGSNSFGVESVNHLIVQI